MSDHEGSVRRLLRWFWSDIRSGENLDLWLLVASALLFTVLGAVGITDTQVLSSVVLALLAVLAISQIRGRQQTLGLVSSWTRSRTDMFEREFPEAYYEARRTATQSFCFAGITMQRTLPTVRPHLVRILERGGSVRILLPYPDNGELIRMAAASLQYEETPEALSQIVRQSLDQAKQVSAASGRRAEVRTTSFLPRVGLNIIDVEQPDAFLMVQMYQHRPISEPGPIFMLSPTDVHWFFHFNDEFERLWRDGTPW